MCGVGAWPRHEAALDVGFPCVCSLSVHHQSRVRRFSLPKEDKKKCLPPRYSRGTNGNLCSSGSTEKFSACGKEPARDSGTRQASDALSQISQSVCILQSAFCQQPTTLGSGDASYRSSDNVVEAVLFRLVAAQ